MLMMLLTHLMHLSPVLKSRKNRGCSNSSISGHKIVFSNTPTESIFNSAEENGVGTIVDRWMRSMLCGRIVQSSLHGRSVRATVKRGHIHH